eukprot:TRINITY_DN4106_c0_g2_i1.p3 TRINITY_DN4106_c0_g2~~TRINITY_DN4106_c0_g2_i1.p3  ORF type:complete len:127 (-),score=34.25 TRINITY_DN4106_c0_g2_i1:210-590(-)
MARLAVALAAAVLAAAPQLTLALKGPDGDVQDAGDFMDRYIKEAEEGASGVWREEKPAAAPPSSFSYARSEEQESAAPTREPEVEAAPARSEAPEPARGAVVDVKLDSELQVHAGSKRSNLRGPYV